jgi:hypothetical protein
LRTRASAASLGGKQLLFFGFVQGPVDTISQGLSTAHKHGEGPEPLVATEDLLPVVGVANIVDTYVVYTFLVQVLDGCLVVQG